MGLDLGEDCRLLCGSRVREVRVYAQSEKSWEHGAYCARGAALGVESILSCNKVLKGGGVRGAETVFIEECALWHVTRSVSHPDFPECYQTHRLLSMIRFVPENNEGARLQV